MKIGSGKPVVRATLVVARSRHQPTFISLMWSDKAIVIPRSAATKILQSLPRRADRGRQNGIVAMIQPRLPVIPSAARNLKSITTRPVSQCHAYIVTKSENSERTLLVGFTFETDTLDSSTPLRCAQNDSDGVAFSSIGEWVDCQMPTPVSPLRGKILSNHNLSPADGETSYPNLTPAGGETQRGGLRNSTHGD